MRGPGMRPSCARCARDFLPVASVRPCRTPLSHRSLSCCRAGSSVGESMRGTDLAMKLRTVTHSRWWTGRRTVPRTPIRGSWPSTGWRGQRCTTSQWSRSMRSFTTSARIMSSARNAFPPGPSSSSSYPDLDRGRAVHAIRDMRSAGSSGGNLRAAEPGRPPGGSQRRFAVPPCLDHPKGDGAWPGQPEFARIEPLGELGPREPVCRSDLLCINANLGCRRARKEANHHRTRKRPRLATEIVHVGQRDVGFLTDLAMDRLLQGFAGLHEAGQHRHPGTPRGLAAQQDSVSSVDDRDDHSWIRPWKMIFTAGFAVSREAAVDHDCPAPTARAVRFPTMPVGQRSRRSRDVPLVVAELMTDLAHVVHFTLGQRLNGKHWHRVE